jgi:hypothetical protein
MPPGVRARLRIVPEVFRGVHIASRTGLYSACTPARAAVPRPGGEVARGSLGQVSVWRPTALLYLSPCTALNLAIKPFFPWAWSCCRWLLLSLSPLLSGTAGN